MGLASGSERRRIKVSVITRGYAAIRRKQCALNEDVSLATPTTAQGSERIRTMAASASVLSNLFTSFSTSGDSMYCDRDRDM